VFYQNPYLYTMFDDDDYFGDNPFDSFDNNEEFHIVPLDEFEAHDLTSKCKCQPENIDGYWIHIPLREVDVMAFLTDPSNFCYN